jgi:putative ABC transport system permease protein
MGFGEALRLFLRSLRLSLQSLRANPVRSLLTCLGMAIGNASVILVVTISQTSQDYILEQIRGLGSNIIYAYFVTGSQAESKSQADFVHQSDVVAVREALGARIVAATGVMSNTDHILIEGKQQDVKVIGVDQYYRSVRNLVLLAGRFFDAADVDQRSHVALLTEKLAVRMYGGQAAAVGQTIKVFGWQFTLIGTFKERVESFGQTEVAKESVLIPISVLRYFNAVERIDPLYVQARSAREVEPVTQVVRQILESRHRPGAKYTVENLTEILNTAQSIGFILEIVLILVSAIALTISGIGIMNIMLVTVTERTREIGLRMAVGAARREILAQFLSEAVLISLAGGIAGIAVGVAIPFSVRFFEPALRIPVSTASILVAFAVSCLVGVVFGILPAVRASRLSPTEALRYE